MNFLTNLFKKAEPEAPQVYWRETTEAVQAAREQRVDAVIAAMKARGCSDANIMGHLAEYY